MKTKLTFLSLLFAGAMSAQVSNNLLLDLDFENGIVDSSSQNQSTVITGTVGFGNDRWSNATSAAQFSGYSVPGNVSLLNSTGNYKVSYPATISIWTSLNSYGSPSSPLITTEDHSTNYSGLWVEVLPTGAILASFGNNSAAGSTSRKSAQTAAGVIALNTWYHVVAVYRSSSVIDIYVNGFKKTVTMSGTALGCLYDSGSGTPGKIGGYLKGSTNKTLDGFIDKAKIFGAALNQDEIWALYYNSHSNRSRLLFDYQMDGNISDSSTYAQPSTPVGTPILDSDRFNVPNSSIATSGTSGISLTNTSGNFKCFMPITFATWLKINSYANGGSIFTNEDASSYTGIWVQVLSTGQLAVSIGDGTGTGPSARRSYLTTDPIPNDGQWRHVVVTLVQAPSPSMFTLEVYINGVLVPSGSGSGNCSGIVYGHGPSDFGKIGTYSKGVFPTGYFNGSLDEVMMWDTLLTSQQILDLYNEQVFNGQWYVGLDKKDAGQEMKLYPNPAKEFLMVDMPKKSGLTTYFIYDITGKIIETGSLKKEDVFKLDLKNYPIGLYILKLNSESESFVQKFIKE